jgi:hypothetical protein
MSRNADAKTRCVLFSPSHGSDEYAYKAFTKTGFHCMSIVFRLDMKAHYLTNFLLFSFWVIQSYLGQLNYTVFYRETSMGSNCCSAARAQ